MCYEEFTNFKTANLLKLIDRPESISKQIRRILMFMRDILSVGASRAVSSTYCKQAKSGFVGKFPTWEMKLIMDALFRIRARTSTPKRKRYGDSGSPCPIPLLQIKCGAGHPFINTEEVAFVSQFMIYPIHLSPKSLALSISKMKFQLIESNAFAKSSLMRSPSEL